MKGLTMRTIAYVFGFLLLFRACLVGGPLPDAISFKGNFYKIVIDDSISWRDAAAKADKLEGNLVSIESDLEFEFLSEELKKISTDEDMIPFYWVGHIIPKQSRMSTSRVPNWTPGPGCYWLSGRPIVTNTQSYSMSRTRYGMIHRQAFRTSSLEDLGPSSKLVGYIIEWERLPDGRWLKGKLPPLGDDEVHAPSLSTGTSLSSEGKTVVQEVAVPQEIAEAFAGSPEVKLVNRQASVNALLVVEVAEEKYAGSTSKLNLTAVPTKHTDSLSSLRFNQEVGPMMLKAMAEVVRYQRIRSGGWPYGHQIEIAFKDKYVDKDGPSAAVACALLVNSIISGEEIDPGFAVTGDLNADGNVQPIGGVSAKVKAAAKAKCSRVAIPIENAEGVKDLTILEGLGSIVSVPVFTIQDFGEAWDIAKEDLNDSLKISMSEFGAIQNLYQRSPRNFRKSLYHPAVKTKLAVIQENAPNLLSARILLDIANGSFPNRLSLDGSLSWIELQSGEVLAGIRQAANRGTTAFDGDGLADAIVKLQKMRTRIDPRCVPYSDAIVDFGKMIRTILANPPASGNSATRALRQIEESGLRIDAAREVLMRDVKVVSELL
ncbi:MAG: hypothetical protein P1U89_21405 [Verrucomicrobiales bacterium]|nr:hypothetical protein [Verrucomicrobiales bacterium]